MPLGRRLLVAALSSAAALIAAYFILVEVAVRYEMWATHMASRSELGQDLGFGLLVFPIILVSTGCAIAAGWLTWKRLRRAAKVGAA